MRFTILLWLLATSFAFAQTQGGNIQSSPSQAPTQDLFSLSRDQVGVFQNSVNLFTGEVAFSLPLVSLPGRGGLDASIGLSYNSAGVRQQMKRWNLEAPTGLVGLGWEMDITHIAVDNKLTGTRADDQFYLVEGGVSSALVQVDVAQNGVPVTDNIGPAQKYESINYKFWDIYYLPSQEKWVIVKEDGTKVIYGDQESARNTVQYLVHWGNWIGNSSRFSGQQQQVMQWDLSEVWNIFGDKTTFTYDQVMQPVGSNSGKQHTEASYLTEITNPQGQTITLVYQDKFATEYQEPHTERPEPDAYQERYERRALDQVEVRDESGALRYTIDLRYEISGTGNFTKRLLTHIQKIGTNGAKLPPLQLSYESSGETAGLLKQVTTSQGAQINYTRTEILIDNSQRDLQIKAPDGYAESQTWIGTDYVVVAWRALGTGPSHSETPRDVKLYVYQWEGRWIEQFRQTIGGVALERNAYKDFEVVTRPNFFAVKHRNSLFLSHKDEKRPGIWMGNNFSFDKDDQSSRLLAGDNFVAVGGRFLGEGETSAWRWNGSAWDKKTFSLPKGDYAYTAANNYFIAHDNDPLTDNIFLFYLDELQQWHRKKASAENDFSSGNGAGSGQSAWYGTNSFAVVLADDNEEFIYQWDEKYTLQKKAGILGAWTDENPAFLTGNGMIGLENARRGGGKVGAFRYDGTDWIFSDLQDINRLGASFGDNFFVWNQATGRAGLRWYDPNTRNWRFQNLIGRDEQYIVTAGANYAFYGDDFYYYDAAGVWNQIYTLSSDLGEWSVNDYRTGGGNLTAILSEDNDTHVFKVINGAVQTVAILENQSIDRFGFQVRSSREMMSSDIVVTFADSQGDVTQENAFFLTLHKLVDGQLTARQTAYPISHTTVNDGHRMQRTNYQYTNALATMSPDGSVAQFNEVKVVAGTSNPGTSTPYGYTTHYFFNGLSQQEAGLPFPSSGLSSSNAAGNYGKLLGLPYATQTFNGNKTLVAESESVWRVYNRDLLYDDITLNQAYYTQIVQRNDTQDGVTRQTSYTYGGGKLKPAHAQVTQVRTTDSEGRQRIANYEYTLDVYENSDFDFYLTQMVLNHMHSKLFNQQVTVDGTTVYASETTYDKQDKTIPEAAIVPTKTVVYTRGDTEGVTIDYRYDAYGNLLESGRSDGLRTATLWGYNNSRPVSRAIGATYPELAQSLPALAQAQVSTYTYDPIYGMTSEIDPNGRATSYEYDDLGRLLRIRDQENRILRQVAYDYYQDTTVPEDPEPEPEPEPEPCTTAPTATISGANKVSIGFEATFTAQASGCASVTGFNWDATRGQVVSTSGNRATILWRTCGQDDVLLTITDSNGRSRTVSKTITVDDPNGDDCGGRDPRGPVAPQQIQAPVDTTTVNP